MKSNFALNQKLGYVVLFAKGGKIVARLGVNQSWLT